MKIFSSVLLFLLLTTGAFAQIASETRELENFDKISLSGGYESVVLQEGARESIALEAKGVELDKIETKVKNGRLEVGMKKGNYRNTDIRLTITYRKLSGIDNSGSSDIVTKTPIKGDSFVFNSSGSGNFKGEFDVRKLEINISGSSDMHLSGKADKQDIAISGSGDVDAAALKGSEASVAISGSGDVDLNINGPVRTSVSGSGKVNNN